VHFDWCIICDIAKVMRILTCRCDGVAVAHCVLTARCRDDAADVRRCTSHRSEPAISGVINGGGALDEPPPSWRDANLFVAVTV